MARDFDGTDDKTVHTLVAEQYGLTTYSYAGWFYFDSNSQYRRLFQKGNAYPNLDHDVEFDDGYGMIFIDRNWGTTDGAWSITKPSTGAWTHICITYDAGATTNDPTMYVNGVSQTVTERSTPAGTFTAGTQTNFYLGTDSGAGQYHDGKIAEFAMWNRVLTSAEVTTLGAKAFSPLFVSNGLVMYLPLIGRTSPEIELINGASGTLTGTTNANHPRIIYPTGGL